MKKTICILFGTLVVLTACGSIGEKVEEEAETELLDEEEVEQDEAEPEVTPEEDIEEEESEIEAGKEGEDEEAETAEQQPEASESVDGEQYEEYEKIASTVDVANHSVQTVEDNQGKRVLLFVSDEGVKQYKSIFIKHDNRLKIININGGGQIFNERI